MSKMMSRDEALLKAMGVRGVADLNIAKNFHFNNSVRFSSSITAGSTDTQTLRVGSGRAFVVDSIRGVVWATAAQGGSSITSLSVSVGTADATVADVGAAFSQSTLNNNFRDVADKINELITAYNTNQQYPAGSQLSIGGDRGQNPANLVDLKFEDQRGEWQNDWMPWPTIVGTALQPAFPMFKPVIPANGELKCMLRNNSAVTISAVIVFEGHTLGA